MYPGRPVGRAHSGSGGFTRRARTRLNSPLPGPPDEAVTIEPVTMTWDSSCRGSSGLAESILAGLGREVRMSRVFVNRTIIPNPSYGLTRQVLGDP